MSGALGALTGSIMGVLQAPAVEPAFLAIRMSKIWFAFGFGFFATREYVMRPWTSKVWPMLDHQRHFHDMAPTLFSGGVMGGITAAVLKRPIVPGMFTISGFCVIAQLIANEASLLWTSKEEASLPSTEVVQPTPVSPDVASNEVSGRDQTKPSLWQRTKDFVSKNSPIQPISDMEYKQRLLRRKAEIEAELKLLEEDMQVRRKMLTDLNE
ncbi:hypothetical protein ACI68E_001796 [Malassezia pachydermatis]